MNSDKNVKEKSKKYFDSIASDYNNSFDGKFVNCMYKEIVDRILTFFVLNADVRQEA